MIYALILAGGIGSRMNSDTPKQFLTINLKPIFLYSIEEFSKNKDINKIIICVPRNWINYTKKIINNNNIIVIEGADNRIETLINGCNYIKENYIINNNDIILTHDAVRPFINQRIINDNIKAMSKYSAATTLVEAVDTIIKSNDGHLVKEIPNRDIMYHEQTPQTFNLLKLIKYYQKLTIEEKFKLTDATKIFALEKEKIGIVKGEKYNIKITTQFDLLLADLIINKMSDILF